jgi:ribonuclease HII
VRCSVRLENRARQEGYARIAGADEVGRGALFGPVVAAAVILDPARPIRGLNDSKQLDRETREKLAPKIRERAIAWKIAAVDAARIDWINIYQASRLAMRRAIVALDPAPDLVLVDALTLDIAIPQRSIIHGDALSVSIAAASILAKVERDAIMREWDAVYPGYGLGSNKGYSTPDHYEGLLNQGAAPLHRLSYAPVADVSVFPSPAVDDMQLLLFS